MPGIRDLVKSGQLEVEHDFVHPDDIPGYWENRARESGLLDRLPSSAAGPNPVVIVKDAA